MAYTTIDDPSVYFQTKLYSGNSTNNTAITNDGNSDLQPDWIWAKSRTNAHYHDFRDSSRGVTKRLASNVEDAESTKDQSLVSFDSDGFTLGDDTDSDGSALNTINTSSNNYVAWQWKCNGGTTSSFTESGNNPGGTIQTNTDAGFSIITTTGTGGAGTIQHGLGAVPHWIISKGRSNDGGWVVYHRGNTSAPETDALNLSSTGATVDAVAWFNDTAPTSSVFTVGTTNDINGDGRTYIHYVFTEIQGYSKFGSYTGNGNADGTFVYTGFKPAWLMFKKTSGTDGWGIFDNRRNTQTGNPRDIYLQPNNSNADSSESDSVDFLSNGFKWRISSGFRNESGQTYIYMAFAESPFVSSEGVPTTAR
jgi:hypothetical protein